MSDVVEGRNAVFELLTSGGAISEVLLADGMRPDERLDQIVQRAQQVGVPVRRVPRRELDTLSVRGAHQGVVAKVPDFEYAELHDVLTDEDDSLVIVLDHVTDPQNLGAIIRSAEALGAHGVVIPKARAASIGPAAIKASAGATAHLPVARVPNIARALDQLKKAGYWAAGASERGDQTSWDGRPGGKLALVLGAEGVGLSRLVEESCDLLVRIPLSGRTPSLNVTQAATILAYEWTRGRTP
jgi:23S rRNA (guanosine2251-2'-O)-methyltransferase